MKTRTSFLKRCLACLLALLMINSVASNGIASLVSAVDEDKISTDAGKLVADNYELTDAEKAFLSSGLLIGDRYDYAIPADAENLISIDTENAQIRAKAFEKWIPTVAYILAGGEVVETVTLNDGTGNYDPTVGNAFAVQVDYVLNIAVAEETQAALLGAAALLNQGIANTNQVSAQSGNLYILEQALPELAKLVSTGIQTNFGTTISFTDDLKQAVYRLNDQIKANNGKLNLSLMVDAYDAGSKTEVLMIDGTDMKDEVAALVADLKILNVTLETMVGTLSAFVQYGLVDAATAAKVETVAAVAAKLEQNLTSVADDSWEVLNASFLKDGMTTDDYAKLDVLVAAMNGVSTPAPAVKNPLMAGEVTLQKNMSMFDVTVNVALQVVENKADSATLVTYGEESLVITLAENATAEEILAAVEASGIVADAQAAWGVAFVAEQFAANTTELPDALTEDLIYTITYAPVEYKVTLEYAEELTLPYGYQLTLPAHEDVTKAYDYDVNGVRYAQGDVYTVVGDTQISRTSGKAYTATDLYTVVANNYGNDVAKAILTSGALLGNQVIAYREPDPTDAESLLSLIAGELNAKEYASKYEGLNWAPYTYGTNGDENLFEGNTADWNSKAVKVQYILKLTNFTEADVQAVLDLAAQLKSEADVQTATLNRFASYHSTMGQLDKTKLGALNGVIDVTDFTPGDGNSDDKACMAMRAYFKGLVGGIIADNLDTNNQLKIYNILSQYKSEGLRYYYNNYELILAEINSLSRYLSDMLADEDKVAALQIMVSEAGFPEYAEKITSLEAVVSQVKADLIAPNAAIDLTSANLGKLMDVLTGKGKVVIDEVGSPWILSKVLTAMDNSQVMVQVIIEAGNASAAVTTDAMDRGTVLTAEIIAALEQKIQAQASQLLGGKDAYYDLTLEGTALENLVGVELNDQVNIYYIYTAKEYTVKIDGEADQIITVDNLEIKLPKHTDNGWSYCYTVDGVEGITTSTYTFTLDQLNTLFADGSYTIARVAVDEAAEKLENTFGDWLVKDAEGNFIGLTANVDGNKDGIMGFAMKLVNSGYSYVGLNGEALLYMNEDNSLEISLQTLINAILNDNGFGSKTLIELGKNGSGRLVAATMQLGNSADDIQYNVDFVLNMATVPAQMATVANGLAAIEKYMSFQAEDGVMNINVTLPQQIYTAYLTALVPTGYLDKNDMNAVNSEIAYQFLVDYVNMVLATDANATTLGNTLALLDMDFDLSGYNGYYNMVKKALTNKGVSINPTVNGLFDMSVTAKGQKAIDGLIGLVGFDASAFGTYLGMIKEYKYADAELSVAANASLTNTAVNYQAVMMDLDKLGLPTYVTELTAKATAEGSIYTIMLLDDVKGDLIFGGTTILDLNGKTVDGNIISNGKLYIIDSYLDNATGGYVTGDVSGKVVIMGGKFDTDVTAMLKDGYKQVDGVVTNALYTLESDGTNLTVVLNADVMKDESVKGYLPNVKALAVEIASDLALNNMACAALSINGDEIFDLTANDILSILTSSSKADAALLEAMDFINAEGITNFANTLLADLLDLEAVEAAIASGEPIVSYELTTAAWQVKIGHNTKKDVLTIGLGSNPDMTKTRTLSVKIADPSGKGEAIVGALADIVDADVQVNLEQPTYNTATNTVSVAGSGVANVNVDLTVDYDYMTVLTVILANGNPANKAELIAALNSGDEAALKAAVDALTVRDVITAVKSVKAGTSFTAMANKAGVTVDVADAAELEAVFHAVLSLVAKAANYLEVVAPAVKLGSFDKDDDGVYECSYDATKTPDISRYGFTLATEVAGEINLTVKLFEDCLWGDANHDGVVNNKDATLVLRYYAGLADASDLCLKRSDVNQDGVINNKDATLILRYYAGLIEKLPYEG